VWGTLDK